MKKLLALMALLALISPVVTMAAEIKINSGSYYLNSGENMTDNLYTIGEGVFISGTAENDVIAGGGQISVSGNIKGDLLAIGGSIYISGTIEDDVRIGGGQVEVSGNIAGDLVVGAGQVSILPQAVIGGDLIVGSGRIDIQGKINGAIRAAAGEVVINNEIGKEVNVRTGKLSLGEKAVINGNLNYSAPEEAIIASGSLVRGENNFRKTDYQDEKDRTVKGFLGAMSLMSIIMLIVAGLFFALIFKKPSHVVSHEALGNMLPNLGRGFIFLIIAPVVSILLLVSMIGVPLGILFLLLYVAMLMVAYMFGAIIVGAGIEKWIAKKEMNITWKTVLWGALAFFVLGWIPFLGGLFKFVIFMISLGSVVHLMKREWWIQKAETV